METCNVDPLATALFGKAEHPRPCCSVCVKLFPFQGCIANIPPCDYRTFYPSVHQQSPGVLQSLAVVHSVAVSRSLLCVLSCGCNQIPKKAG